MGRGSWDADDYSTRATSFAKQTVDQVYTTQSRTYGQEVSKELNPHGVKVRESCDSPDNPNSNPIAIFLDVTSSMGPLAHYFAKQGLGTLFTNILDRKPVSDPHLMFGAIGDVRAGSRWPLQVSQFEASNVIIDQLVNLYVEGGGGGNSSESYSLAHYFAGFHTKLDSVLKRDKKGYLFTIGDDGVPPPITADEIHRIFGYTPEKPSFSARECLQMAHRFFNVFHIMLAEGSTHNSDVVEGWRSLLGERALLLEDHHNAAELIVSTIQVCEGSNVDDVANSWNGNTALVVRKALGNLVKSDGSSGGIVTL